MTTPNQPSDVALVLETNNLASSDAAAVVASLARLLRHLRGQTLELSALAQLVVTHDGIACADQDALVVAAGRPITFVPLSPTTGYYQAKNAGFFATDAPIVAFGDADCWPAHEWLELLVEPLADGFSVAAGRTTYRDDAIGRALSSIDFLYFRDRTGRTTRNFYANNVAFTRTVFERYHYRDAPMYRGACQLLGMELAAARVPIRYVQAAHTVHRLPDDLRELLELRIRRGRDLRELAPHVLEAAVPNGRRIAERPTRSLAAAVVAGRWACSLRHLAREARPLRHRTAEAGLMCGVAALDALAALGPGRATGHEEALSYHGDRDGLSLAAQ